MHDHELQVWRDADAILDELLGLDSDAQQARLEELADRSEVRAAVLALLRQVRETGGVLDQEAGTLLVEAPDTRLTAATGRSVGAWILREELGRGGMAVVYRATRRHAGFEQTAALKLLTIGMLGNESAARFQREQRILASLQHPHIASLIDGGLADDGTPYLVMEHVRGETIDRHCEENDLAAAERVHLLLQVCDAVAFAHRHLVVHRDIKPSNVLVDERGEAKLLDFGIAKLIEEEAGRQTSTRILTPGYAAPEQFVGEQVTTATDVFGLGVVLYQLLTGCSPFPEGQDSRRNEPNREPLGVVEPDLRNIVLMALRSEPERRYANAGELADDLEKWQENRPVIASPDTRGYRLRKYVRRHRAAVVAAAVAVFGLVVGSGVALWQAHEAREQAAIATREAETAKAIGSFLAGLFESSDPTIAQGEDLRASDILRRGAEELETGLTDQPQTRAELLLLIGGIQSQLGLHDDARPSLERAEQSLSASGDALTLTHTVLGLSKVDMDLGKYEAAEQRLLQHLGSIHENDPDSALRRLLVEARLAEARMFDSRLEESAQTARQALDRMERSGIDDPALRIQLLRHLGAARELSGDLEAATNLLLEAVALERVRQDPPGVDLAVILNDLGIVLGKSNRLRDSEMAIREAIEIYSRLLGEKHSMYASSLQNLALNLYFQNRVVEAGALLREAKDIKIASLGADHPSTGTTIYSLARVQHDLGRLDEAEANFLEARRIYSLTLPPQHHSHGDLLSLYGALLFDGGRLSEAETVVNEALEIQRANVAEEHVAVATAKLRLGRTLVARGRLDEARKLLEEAFRTILSQRGDADTLTQEARVGLAELHLARRDTGLAEELAQAARAHLSGEQISDRRLLNALMSFPSR